MSIFQSRLCYGALSSTMEVYIAAVVIDKPTSNEKCVLPSVKIKAREKVADDPKTINWAITTNFYPDTTSSKSNEEKVFSIKLPDKNNKFGNNTIRARATARGTNYDATAGVKFFFDKTATNHPGGGTPNWYYYWKQTSASSGSPKYDSSLSSYGRYDPGNTYFSIGQQASGPNSETSHDGIDCFAETCLHENLHQSHWWNWISPHLTDSDGDWMPDAIEDRNGDGIVDPGETDPQKPDTDGNGIDDEEELCYQIEHTWNAGSANLCDWSYPGHQY